MAMVKGMLMQSKGKHGIVMTSTGEFINVVLPDGNIRLGEEIEAVKYRQRKPLKYLVAVVAMFLMVLLIPGYQHFYPKEAMAYVALDINPSIELAVNKDLKISAVEGLDSDGKKMVTEVDVIGMQLYQALPLLVEQAIIDGYLEPECENVVLSTVTITENKNANKNKIVIEENKIQQAINKPIQSNKMAARVVVEQSATTDRKQAKKVGLSTGKYLLYKEAQKNGFSLTVDEIRDQGIYQLEKQKQVKVEQLFNKLEQELPPGQSKKLEQHLPPGQSKKLEQQLPPGQSKKLQQQQPITPKQAEQLHNKPQTDHRTLRQIEKVKKGDKDNKDTNDNSMRNRIPGLEKKQYRDDYQQWLPPGIEKKLEQKQQNYNDNKQKNNNVN